MVENKKKYSVDDALEQRKASKYSVDQALEDRQNRIINNIDSIMSDLQNRYTSVSSDYEDYSSNYKPSWGMSLRDELDAQRSRSIAVNQLLRDFEAYKKYMPNEASKGAIESLGKMKSEYSSMLNDAARYSSFNSEDDYNRYSIGWLNDVREEDNKETYDYIYSKDMIKARKDYLKTREDRIAELDELIKKASGDEKKKLVEEKESLVADVNQYKRSSQGIKDQYYGYTFNSDFESDSKKRDYNNPTREEVEEQDSYSSGFYDMLEGRGIYEIDEKNGEYVLSDGTRVKAPDALDIPDKLGAYLSASEEEITEAYNRLNANNGNSTRTWDNLMQEGDTNRWHLLDENEIAIYYYLYNNQGQWAAYKFLDDMSAELGRRENENTAEAYNNASTFEKIGYNIATIPANAIGGVSGLFEDAINTIQRKEINPYSAAHRLSSFSNVVRNETAEEINDLTNNASIPVLGFTAGDAYQALMSGADSYFGGKTLGRGFTFLMSSGASTQMAQDLYERGATNTQVAAGAIAAGVAEALFEYISLDKLLSTNSTKSLGGFVKQVLVQGGVEASEEMATEITNTIFDALNMRSQSEWMKLYNEGGFQNAFNETIKNVLNAGLGGFVSGGAMATGNSGLNLSSYNNSMKGYGSDLYNNGGIDTYKDYANNHDVSSRTQKLMKNMDQSVSDSVENSSDGNKLSRKAYRSIGKFADSVDSYILEDATKSEIRSQLESRGMDASQSMVDAVYKYITSDSEIKLAGKEVKAIGKELKGDSTFNGAVSARVAASKIGMIVDHSARKSNIASAEKASEAVKDRVSDTDKAVISETGEEVEIKKVESIDNGEMKLELSDGRIVNSNDVMYASEKDALIYESVLDIGYSTESANAVVSSLNSISDDSVSKYLLGVGEAYRYGLIGQNINTISKTGFASELTDTQLKFAYDLGRADASTRSSQAQKSLNAKKGKSKRKGRVLLSASVSSLTERQRTSVAAVGRVVSDITHNNVVFYESVLKDGNRVFSKDIAGHKAGEAAPNGFYIRGNGTIYIDINAGNLGEGTILYTTAHELGHFVRNWSPDKFKVLADFLIEEYGKKGVDVNQLIQNQIEMAKKNGRSLSFDDAYEEVIADSLETMFTDTNLLEKLAKLKAKDATLWSKIKDFFKNLLAKIKEAYKGLDPQTQEGMYVKQMQDTIERISDLFAEALVDAGDTFMKAGADVGGVSMEYTINDATEGTDVSDITNKPVQKLQERTEYEKYPKEMIKITSSGSERSAMDITINGKKFSGDASVRELRNERFAENGFKAEDVRSVNEFLDNMRDYMKKARLEYKYIGLQDIYDAKIIISPTTGSIVLSGLVNNGEYEINFDFTKTCKKRLALQDVIEQLAREKGRTNDDGTQTEVNLSEENIRHINEVLAANGIETACLCCFVESKRYAMQSHFQEKVCDVWNRLVDEVNAEEGITTEAPFFNFADQEIETSKIPDGEFDNLYAEMERWRNTKYVDKEGGEGSIERKMKAFLENSPSSRKKLRLSDFVTESGRTNLHKLYPEIESLAKAKIGTALPKAVESFSPYNGEIELMSVSGKEGLATYAKKIAGARSQSFSDFIMSHIYDVLQKTASLTARKLTAHTYTKEISRARLFGMTGEKTNMSVLHDIDPDVDSWNAGLKADGSYYVSDYDAFRRGLCNQIQAIPDAESIALQNDPRYSRDCGRIGVGFSYSHMLKMHNDPDIRQVIGYHSSSLPAAIKPLTNLDKSTDYTGVQNTLKFKGFKKPNYVIPEGIPSYATAPQDIEAYNENGKKISKFSKVSDASFDIKGTYEELCKNMESTKAAKETLRQLLQYADDNGLAIETSKAQAGHGDFDLYGDTEATQNPYHTADNYIEYCVSRGMLPMFYEFALNDNYYKDIYDFNVFDRLSYNPETGLHEDSADRKAYAPQNPVHMVNEDGSMAFPDDFWELTDKYMKDFNYQREDFAKKFPKVMEEVRAVKDLQGNPMVYSAQKFSDRDKKPLFEMNSIEKSKKFSYEELVKNDDIKIVSAKGHNISKLKNNNDISRKAKEIAINKGYAIKTYDGQTKVYVKDIGGYVTLTTKGIAHGFRRNFTDTVPVVLNIGEILSNSIAINELNPKTDKADYGYVLFGAAETNDGKLNIVRCVVNHITLELEETDNLKAIDIKKETTATKSQGVISSPIVSYLSVSDLLNYVNDLIPDTLSESVLRHFNRTERPTNNKEEPGNYALFSDRNPSLDRRTLLANALETTAQNDIEKKYISDYKANIDMINAEQEKLAKLRSEIKDMSFQKGVRDDAWKQKMSNLRDESTKTANRINTYDKKLLKLESAKPLQDVLNREKDAAVKKAEEEGRKALNSYREKATKAQRELLERWKESRKKGIDSRNRTAMRHKIKGVVNELNQYLLRGTKERHVPIGLQKAVAEALDAVNMDTVGAEERISNLQKELMKAKTPEDIQEISRKIDRIREMGDKMSEKLNKLKEAYDDIVNSDDPLIANSHDDVISNKLQAVIDSVGDTPLRDMNLSQLEDVYDMYRMVLTTIRNANKAFKAKKSDNISIIANNVMMELKHSGGKKKLRRKGTEGINRFFWNNLKPVYAFEHIGSDHFTDVFNAVRAGEDVWAVDVTEAREYYLDKVKKYKYDSWDLKKRYTFTSTSGMEFSLDIEQIMSLYAYSKRDQAADHLKKGGIVIDESTEITVKNKLGIPVKFNPTEATAYNLSDKILSDIISKLTDEQKQFVDEMQDYLSTVMGEKGNEVSLEMYGVKLFKEKFYFPLKSAQQFMAKAKEQQKGEVKIKNSGFSKETVQKASNPIVLTPFMNVWADHVNDMSMYHAFVLPMEDFYRVYNYKTPTSENMATESVEMSIQNAYGRAATAYIDQLLKDLNGGARTDHTTGIINKAMGLFKKGAVFASMSVVIQQPSAIARAAALVNPKYFIGSKVDHKRHKQLWAEVKKYAPVAIIKEMGYFDTNMGKSTQDFIMGKEYSGFTSKMKALFTDSGFRDEVLSKAPALADEIAWCGIWEAVKRETKANNRSMNTSSEEFLKKVGERFTEVIVKTQVYDSVLSRSGMMRSKDTGMKMATAFMAEPTTSINMIADALLKGKRGNRKYARGAIGAVIASQILNSILVSFVYAGRDDDEDETYIEKYIGTLTGEILDSLNPAGYIPFIKDIMSIVQGYDVERSDMAVISDLWKAWENLSKDNMSTYRKVEGFAGSIAQIFGLPVKNIMRDTRGIYQTIESFVNGQQTTSAGIRYAVQGAVTGKTVQNYQQLYEAIISGDQTQIERVKGRFDDQVSINTAIRKALRENDPRIHEAALAWNENDLEEYMRIAKQIIAENHFSQDDVVMAIRSEANSLISDDTEGNSKVHGLFTADNFKEAISQGDMAIANDIRDDLIQTAQDNGKSLEEAEKSVNKSIKSSIMELLSEDIITKETAIDLINQYAGMEWEEAEKSVNNSIKRNIMELLSEGSITKETAIDLIASDAGMEWEKAEKTVNNSIKSSIQEQFEDGSITKETAIDLLVSDGGMERPDAKSRVQYWEFTANNPTADIKEGAVTKYYTDIQPSGISVDVYLAYYDQKKTAKGVDADGDGKTNSGSKRMEILYIIDSLPISDYQKDVLYYAEGYSEKTISDAPWH